MIGDFIYTHVEKFSDNESAPKITGMIIDLSEQDIIQSVGSLAGLKDKIEEGKKLLNEDESK